MHFPGVRSFQNISGPERNRLEALDDAINSVLLQSLAIAESEGLNPDQFAQAAVTLLLSAAARQALDVAEKLEARVAPHDFRRLAEETLRWSQLRMRNREGLRENRRHQRIWPRNANVTIVTEDGAECATKLLDMSASGAAVSAKTLPPVGARITIGRTSAHVVRTAELTERVIAVEFARPFDIDTFNKDTEL